MIYLSVCDCVVELDCRDDMTQRLLLAGYGQLAVSAAAAGRPQLSYRSGFDAATSLFRLVTSRGLELTATNESEFLFLFDKDLTIELQHRRPDLLFLHAAAVEYSGRVVLLVAPSGTGKSTLTWALLHAGFGYLSDELGPVELASMRVSPYPHALCLKSDPPDPFPLPAGALRLGETLHVPVGLLPGTVVNTPTPLAAVVFIHRDGNESAIARRLAPGEAAARLYTNALNPLAHAGEGLDPVVAIVGEIPCYQLDCSDLRAAGAAIMGLVAGREALSQSR